MDKILAEFGVQPVLLAAQVVNFLILLFLLKKFLYKPILKVLDARKERIVQSLKQAEEIEKRLNEISEEEQKRILKAAADGEKIMKGLQEQGVAYLEESKLKGQEILNRALEEAKNLSEVERQKLRQEMRLEMANLVAEGLKVVAGKVLTEKEKKEMTQKALKNIT